MRKLERKDLKSLELIMPVLSEMEQRECFGGVIYFGSGAEMIGWDGSSYEIYVTDQYIDLNNCEPISSGNFSSQPEYMKMAVIDRIAQSLGMCQEGTEFEDMYFEYAEFPESVNDKMAFEGISEEGNHCIFMNTNHKLFKESNNYFDFELTIIHEMEHAKNVKNELDNNMSEYLAYSAMLERVNSSSNCSAEYYSGMYMKYEYYFNELLKENRVSEKDLIKPRKEKEEY